MDNTEATVPYTSKSNALPAFDLLGFTQVVKSGGELYAAVMADGRWQVLQQLAGSDKCIYGVASLDKQCPTDHYRYTIAIKRTLGYKGNTTFDDQLFPFHVRPSRWIAFTLEHFESQYSGFWQIDPYKMIKQLGHSYNKALSIHIDVYPETYSKENDKMELWMPVRS